MSGTVRRQLGLDVCNCAAEAVALLQDSTRREAAAKRLRERYDQTALEMGIARLATDGAIVSLRGINTYLGNYLGPASAVLDYGLDRVDEIAAADRADVLQKLLRREVANFRLDTNGFPPPQALVDNIDLLIGPNSAFADIPELDKGPLRDEAILILTKGYAALSTEVIVQGEELAKLKQGFRDLNRLLEKDRAVKVELPQLIQKAPVEMTQFGKRPTPSDIRRAEEIASAAEDIVTQGNAASAIFRQLGNEKAARAADVTVAGGILVVSAARLSAGDASAILPAIASVGSVFGRRPDPNAPVLAALRALSSQINDNHVAVIRRFDRTDYSLAYLTDLSRHVALANVQMCGNLKFGGWVTLPTQSGLLPNLDLTLSQGFASRDDMVEFYQENPSGQIEPCLKGIASELGDYDRSLRLFRFNPSAFADDAGNPERNALGVSYSRKIEWSNDFMRLGEAYLDLREVVRRAALARPWTENEYLLPSLGSGQAEVRFSDQSIDALTAKLGDVIDIPLFVRVAQYVPFLLPLFDVSQGQGDPPFSIADIRAGKGSKFTHSSNIASATSFVARLGMVQESIRLGQPLIELLHDVWIGDPQRWNDMNDTYYAAVLRKDLVRTPASWAAFRKEMLKLVNTNDMMLVNILWYDLYKNFNGSDQAYAYVQTSGEFDVTALKGYWSSQIQPFEISNVAGNSTRPGENRFERSLDNKKLPLPNSRDFPDRPLLFTIDYSRVIALLELTESELLNVQVGRVESLTNDEKLLIASYGIK